MLNFRYKFVNFGRRQGAGGVAGSVVQRAGEEAVSVANGVLAQMELLLAETGRDKAQVQPPRPKNRYFRTDVP